MRTFTAKTALYLLSTVVLAACSSQPEADSEDDDSALGDAAVMKLVEVSSNPVGGAANAFIELRNDGDQAMPVDGGLSVKVDETTIALSPRKVLGATQTSLLGHQLALVVDDGMADAEVTRVACDAAIATTRAALGSAHAAPDDLLMGSIGVQSNRHCVPVFSAQGLGQKLAAARKVAILKGSSALDSAQADFGHAPRGIAYERKGPGDNDFALSPLGSTPGTRNFYSSDPAQLQNAKALPPMGVYFASPWRNTTAPATPRDAQGLPPNPLVASMNTVIRSATKSAVGSWYQINDPDVIGELVKAKTDRHADVRVTTDGEFEDDDGYKPGWAKFKAAGVPVKFDVNDQNKNRAPLSHNKFLVVDDQWVFTGSFNPITDDPARIHADNAIHFRSRNLAALQKAEFETLFSGKFGTDKRDTGQGGGDAYVDGSRVSLRFSPGITDAQAKARAAAFSATNDVKQACEAAKAGRPVIQDRYRSLDPCGGPLDMLYGEVARATSSVYFVEFSLALPMLGDLLVERMKAGVEVKGVVDATIATKPLPTQLKDAGGDVRATPNSDPTCPAYVSPRKNCPSNPNKVWLHHKYLLIDYGTDHPVVITGSHNMSDSAEQQNDETLVVIRDRAVAESYYRIFRDAFDHPQALGPKRPKMDAPALAITKVQPTVDPKGKQFVEVTNLDVQPRSLNGLALWNRQAQIAITDDRPIAPGAKAILVVGDPASVQAPQGGIVIGIAPAGAKAFISPTTPLVLAAADRGWISTYDPYQSAQNVPAGVTVNGPTAMAWTGFDRAALDNMARSYLGVNSTPEAAKPTWTTKGQFSDWADEFDVTPVGLLLMTSQQAAWKPAN